MTYDLSDTYTRPDWVMCGMPWNGGVRLIASKTMTYVELQANFDQVMADIGLAVIPVVTGQRITLTAGMGTFTIVDAPDYPAAFQRLFETWQPGGPQRQALGGQPAIGGPE